MTGFRWRGIRRSFSVLTSVATKAAGHPITFSLAILSILIWLALGPYFQFSDTYQLYINTGTTIVTFLMCFLIQASQNRDTLALHAKLDALIKNSEASNAFIAVERRTEEEIEEARASDGLSP